MSKVTNVCPAVTASPGRTVAVASVASNGADKTRTPIGLARAVAWVGWATGQSPYAAKATASTAMGRVGRCRLSQRFGRDR